MNPTKPTVFSVTCVAVSIATAVITVAVSVILAVTLTYSLKAADEFAATYSQNSISAAQNKVSDFIKLPVDAYAQLKMGADFGLLPKVVGAPNDEARRQMFLKYVEYLQPILFAAEFQLVYVACGLTDGSWMSCYVRNQTTFEHYCLYINLLNGTSNSMQFNFNGTTLISSSVQNTVFDPRTRTWYTGGPRERGAMPLFGSAFISSSFGIPVVGVNGPLHAKDGTFIGITAIPLDLRRIALFLSNMPHTENGITALVDELGYMIGASDRGALSVSYSHNTTRDGPLPAGGLFNANGCGLFGANTRICRLTPKTYSSPTLRELAEKEPNVFANDQATFTRKIELSGQYWMLSKAPILANTGVHVANISWHIYTLMPVSDVTGPIITGRNAGIAVACVMVIVSCVACGIALFVLLSPLSTLSNLMEQAAELKDDTLGAAMSKSAMREIRAIQDSFERLSAQLKKAKSFLPAALLAQLEDSSDAEDEVTEAETTRAGANSVSYVASNHDAKTTMSSNHRRGRAADGASQSTAMNNSSVAAKKIISSNISLSQRSVTIAVLNLRNFHRNSSEHPIALESNYGRLVDEFQKVAKDHRGIMDSFHGDRFTFTFNTVKPCATHASMAAMSMLKIVASIERHNSGSSVLTSSLTCGIATGRCHIGNLGSEKAKRFTVIGPAFSQATVLERLCKRYPNTSILLSSESINECETQIGFMYMDVIDVPGRKAMPIAVAKYLKESVLKKNGDDEWMYEMDHQTTTCTYHSGNRAFLCALHGDVSGAQGHLATFTDTTEEGEWARDRIAELLKSRQSADFGLYYDRCVMNTKSDWESKADL